MCPGTCFIAEAGKLSGDERHVIRSGFFFDLERVGKSGAAGLGGSFRIISRVIAVEYIGIVAAHITPDMNPISRHLKSLPQAAKQQ
jgi:hypothetical protein